jgi:peptidoglycan-N-acetylmuramic acid deacetylase
MIGNHSWHHYSMPECTDDILVNEIMDLHNYMIEHFQYQMTTLRPPKGEFSEKTLAITQDLGYRTIMWSYAYYDYDLNNQPDEAIAHQKLISHLHPGEILLLHAVSDTNMMILDEFIDDTLSQGYMFIKPQEKMG